MMKRLMITSLLTLPSLWLRAQNIENNSPDMADGLRSQGLIWIVVGVIFIIVAGLLAYLWRLDKKISRLENDFSDKP